jgi:hypothetical protein
LANSRSNEAANIVVQIDLMLIDQLSDTERGE